MKTIITRVGTMKTICWTLFFSKCSRLSHVDEAKRTTLDRKGSNMRKSTTKTIQFWIVVETKAITPYVSY
jgi:hypothetical protein